MATEYKIIKAQDFLRARPDGKPDLAESKRILGEIAVIAEGRGDSEILIDCRDAYGNLDHADLYELVEEMGRHRHAFRNKIAFLGRPGPQFDKGKFLELCATNRGFQVKVFTSFEETIEWLQECEDVEL